MHQIYPDLWVSEPEHPAPDELPDLMMHAYLLVRDEGNILFCRSEYAADHQRMGELGGVRRHYLTHWHEAAPGLARIKARFASKLLCHERAVAQVAPFAAVDTTFRTRETHEGGIEVIPAPGHTPGSSVYRVRSSHGPTYLFAGDTLFPSRGRFEAVIFEDGDKEDLLESLAMLRGLEPDVALFGASVADVAFKAMSPAEWHAALDQAADALCGTVVGQGQRTGTA